MIGNMTTLATKTLAEDHIQSSARSLTPKEVLEAIENRKDEPTTEAHMNYYEKRNQRIKKEPIRIAHNQMKVDAQKKAFEEHHEEQRRRYNVPMTGRDD